MSAVPRGTVGFAGVSLGSGTVVPCRRCGSGAEKRLFQTDTVLAELERAAAAWEGGSGPNVDLCGFEPFAHPELPRIIDAAVRLGFERIRLVTDGGALAQPGNADGCISAGVRLAEIVLIGDDAQLHDSLAGRPGLFALAAQGAQAFLAAGRTAGLDVVLTGRAAVCRHNAESLPGIVTALVGQGAIAVRVECRDGVVPSRSAYRAADVAATTAGVWLFGDGVERAWDNSALEHPAAV